MGEQTRRTEALLAAFGCAAAFRLSGMGLTALLPGTEIARLACTLLQPVVPLMLVRAAGGGLCLCRPQRGAAAPAALFVLAAVLAAWLLPGGQSVPAGLWSFIRLCLAAPLAEELVFRGGVQGLLQPFGSGAAVIVQAVLFAVQHSGAAGMLYALVMGLALGWMRQRTKSVYPGMVLHLLNNLLVFAAG